jgi:hypothetical protein
MNLRTASAASILVVVCGLFCGLASADTITIGTNTSNNGFPFDASNYFGEYQQVYNSSLFSGPVVITGITFIAASISPSTTIKGDFTIDLSTTSSGVSSLSTTYANNIGANNAQFFSGVVGGVLSFTGGPFLFDPLHGNLLLDVNVLSFPTGGGALAAGCSADTNRVFNAGGTGAGTIGNAALCTSSPTYFGLETEFTYTPVVSSAEPPALLMLTTGLLALMGVTRFRILARRD